MAPSCMPCSRPWWLKCLLGLQEPPVAGVEDARALPAAGNKFGQHNPADGGTMPARGALWALRLLIKYLYRAAAAARETQRCRLWPTLPAHIGWAAPANPGPMPCAAAFCDFSA